MGERRQRELIRVECPKHPSSEYQRRRPNAETTSQPIPAYIIALTALDSIRIIAKLEREE
jgi:hypothetical protein